MKFKIYRTSGRSIAPKLQYKPIFSDADSEFLRNVYFIEINTLDDLIGLRYVYMDEIIIKDSGTIEIYDAFRE